MENIQQSSGYKSAWRPMSRESDLSGIGSPSPKDTVEQAIKSIETLTKVNEAEGQNDILKKISEISVDIKGLDRKLQDQSEKIENLLNLLEDREGFGKKYVFGLPRK